MLKCSIFFSFFWKITFWTFFSFFLFLHNSFHLHAMVRVIAMVNVGRNITWQISQIFHHLHLILKIHLILYLALSTRNWYYYFDQSINMAADEDSWGNVLQFRLQRRSSTVTRARTEGLRRPAQPHFIFIHVMAH